MPQTSSHAQLLPSRTGTVGAAFIVATLAYALFWLGWTALAWYRLHPHLPWRDTFVILDNLRPVFESGWDLDALLALFEPHYRAHRIALPRLLIALDLVTWSGQNHLLYLLGWLSMLGILSIYLGMAAGYFGRRPWPLLLLLALALLLMFSPAHLWNIVNPVNNSWHLTFVFSLAAFAWLSSRAGALRLRDCCGALLCTVLAAFSTFGGVIACLLLPLLLLRDSRWLLLGTTLASAIFVTLYLQGISSDAAIALHWDSGDPAAIQAMRDAGRAALEANTPQQMAARAVRLLGWPLSRHAALPAGALVVASVLLLGYHWLRYLRGLLDRDGHPQPWLVFCLLVATLCLGIAVATQLGRVIEQPNFAHGPSQERYQTVVVVYWMAVSGLLLAPLWSWRAGLRLAAAVLLFGLVNCLIVPGGDYLREEVASLQTAARLYAEGERPHLRRPVKKKLLRYTPEYVFTFDKLLRSHGAAWHVPAPLPLLSNSLPSCTGLATVEVASGEVSETRALLLPAGSSMGLLTREIWLSRDGQLAGRLHPVHRGDYRPLQLLRRDMTAWEGVLEGDAGRAAVLSRRNPSGAAPLCQLALH